MAGMGLPDTGENRLRNEVAEIISDLIRPEDGPEVIRWWEVRPLRATESGYGETLRDGTPRYFEVAVSGEGYRVADMADEPAWRDYIIAEWLQDELSEKTTEARPQCPLHRNLMLPETEGDTLVWKCGEDPSLVCNVGTYWSWRTERDRGLGGTSG